MWNRLKGILGAKGTGNQLQNCIAEVIRIKETEQSIVLYGTPTKEHWLGIANATKSLFPVCSLAIPQVYSQPGLNNADSKTLLNTIANGNFKRVVISGFADYFFSYIDYLHQHTDIEVIFHGTIAEFHEPAKQQLIKKMMQYCSEQKIKRIGFIKKGLAEIFTTVYGVECYHCPLPTPTIPKNISKLNLDRSKIHIGVFGADTFNKNLHNQVIHALLIENSIVHVLDKSHFDYLQVGKRIIEHGNHLPREKFLEILGSMDLNLYMSFSESWGLVAYESEAMGVPCLMPLTVDYLSEIKSALHKK
ncbi:MAG: glycosyltransferase [Bacteroidetes bacterium]|nr:glycosyltransferase [Bacteroidota bacterium]